VLVDEFQDTNHAQARLATLLAGRSRNIFVVGDVDQGIYAFRGATIRNLLDFERDWPDAHVITLEQNYRSTSTILDAANAVIENNLMRKPKTLWTRSITGEPITRYHAQNEHDEAGWVVGEIKRLRDEQGTALADMAVFYRTNAQSRVLEEVFAANEVPYRVVGGVVTRCLSRGRLRPPAEASAMPLWRAWRSSHAARTSVWGRRSIAPRRSPAFPRGPWEG
jgi:DNA helicase II / ATP-dependent DNA helicase PcrA